MSQSTSFAKDQKLTKLLQTLIASSLRWLKPLVAAAWLISLPAWGLGVPQLSVPNHDADGTYTISWTAVSGAATYEVWRSKQTAGVWGAWNPQYANLTTLNLPQTSVPAGLYRYVVRACPSSGACGNFGPAIVMPVRIPVKATGLTVPSVDYDGAFSISWNAATAATSYTVWRAQKVSGSWGAWGPHYEGISGLALAQIDLVEGEYRYVVRGCNSHGCGQFTGAVEMSVEKPLQPTGFNVQGNDDDGNFLIDWDVVPDASSYEVWRGQHNGSGWGPWDLQVPNILATQFSQSGLSTGFYRYVVRACSAVGCGNFTAAREIDVMTLGAPAKPAVFNVPSGDADGNYTISWSTVSEATSYDVWWSQKIGSQWSSWDTQFEGLADEQLVLAGIAPGLYRYVVRACNSIDCSGFTAAKEINVQASGGSLTVFPHPPGIASYSGYRVFANGQEAFVHLDYRHNTAGPDALFGIPVSKQGFAVFDFSGQVEVTLEMDPALLVSPGALRIAPASLGITPTVDTTANTVSFTLTQPGNLTVDPLGNGTGALHLFTNSPELNIPSPTDPNVIYYGPGVHDVAGQIQVSANQTLYLAGGSVLRPLMTQEQNGSSPCDTQLHYGGTTFQRCAALVRITGANAKVRGRGVISGERGPVAAPPIRNPLLFAQSVDNFELRDIILTQSSGWNAHLFDCDNALVENLRVTGYFTNSDGILFNSCNNSIARNNFLHVGDDGLEVKTSKNRPSSNLQFLNSQAWVDVGTAMGLTQEINSAVDNVLFKNITVLRYSHQVTAGDEPPYRGAIMVKPAHGAPVSNITFEDINVENHATGRPLILVNNIEDLDENSIPYPNSSITNLTFRNILENSGASNTGVLIYDDAGQLYENILFENVSIDGEVLSETSTRVVTVGDPDITFVPGC